MTAVAAALMLMSSAMATASTSNVAPEVTPVGTTPVCDNNGQGTCLTGEGLGQQIVNEVPQFGADQIWHFKKLGSTTKKAPFTDLALDDKVAVGRAYGQWLDQSNECLAYQGGHVILNNCTASGTEWVLSGSGRLITVLHSDQAKTLVFLNSNGVSGGHPTLPIPGNNTCPLSCWGPMAG
ncbi:MAG TPA: hypothetical protein VFX16_22845 [Pseudonocardiaceae bacterium]|nr:hypothetical protein [Pseudonocardiaceae bacterium]